MDTTGIIGQSTALGDVFRILSKVAPTDTTVLVTGESGTGKELLVRALHKNSPRASKPFVPINCGAIPRELLESELFGHEKGAFTHAIRSRPGRFELADGGTVFLDEIGEMDVNLQVKILRFLQEREFERVGGSRSLRVNVRVVAATNRNLELEVEKGNFREDLYYRLNVIPIVLPPLRYRGKDVLLLAEYFLTRFCESLPCDNLEISKQAKQLMMNYSWPGNIRELENIMERMTILCDNEKIMPEDLPDKILSEGGLEPPEKPAMPMGFSWPRLRDMDERKMNLKEFLDKIEENLLVEALESADGVKNQASEILGIKRTTLIEKLKKKKLG